MDAPTDAPVSPFTDHAAPILQGEPSITDDQRADLWDTFHNSKSAEELVQKLMPLAVPDDTKNQLWQAKKLALSAMPIDPVERTTSAISRMASLDPQTLELAESHPNVLKALTAAAQTTQKEAGEPKAASSASGKGTKAPAAGTPLVQPPRLDGQPHMPPIPTGHRRILASDNSVHDIPEENIEKARVIDPHLHVLNP